MKNDCLKTEHIFNELCATQLDGQMDATYIALLP
jgi:hypothetical protein